MVQADGKILIGGDFTSVSPNGGAAVTRNRIARLNPDGTLDTAFNPNANDSVYTIAVQTDGKILVGGNFSGANSIGGQTRNRIARLDATTGLADSFDPNANAFVQSIAVEAGGKILVGGDFNGANSIGGQTRNFIARLDPITGLADSFNPNANDTVETITVQADGKILAGGFFINIGGQARNRIARLDATTGLADSFNPNANSFVETIAVQADGKILAGGDFSGANSIGGQTRNYIARLDATTGLADSFNPNASDDCRVDRGAGGRQDFGRRLFHHHRRTDAQPHRPARSHHRPGRFVQPERERSCPFNRGAGGRQDSSRRRFHKRRRTNAQPHRPVGNRRQARPDAQSQHRRQSVFAPPPCSRTARFLSAAALQPFWA